MSPFVQKCVQWIDSQFGAALGMGVIPFNVLEIARGLAEHIESHSGITLDDFDTYQAKFSCDFGAINMVLTSLCAGNIIDQKFIDSEGSNQTALGIRAVRRYYTYHPFIRPFCKRARAAKDTMRSLRIVWGPQPHFMSIHSSKSTASLS